ncbi:NAD(P)H-dependent oxidoreductase [Marinobacter adhaerens]|jgi:modulator of drug activity B|uniref:NAD(P)H-dependent oxidoreductase n=2 Tax=Marinobacter adhaerens TaxID=1033846 RepID=A0ABX8IFV7_9GAMM|nr:NAD(P)H-dependent oxidoreductase [Marinobacter adhaerens]ADP97449.1 NAD(P)H dehydrogenase (quinone) [Marinobacter adhaerens HP15]MBW4978599.1 NAD(P)H-dependent oxidoreductase [Marinobacter adhaerens]QWV11531.1 NAD(P)H-dependent oxidoreductase [Marinobacter adhaerens]
MSNVLIINAHHHYSFAEGKLNGTLVQIADELLTAKGHKTRIVEVDNGWNVDQELKNHQWADIVILQTPVNWMGVPWTFKKYMDEVYTAGMGGALCNGDGRTEDAPKSNYGTGGTLAGKKYLISLTFNAPQESFDNPDEYLFQGKSVDDLLFPMHMNFRFFAMEPLETFACYDVMKNPQVEKDFQRFTQHLEAHIPG